MHSFIVIFKRRHDPNDSPDSVFTEELKYCFSFFTHPVSDVVVSCDCFCITPASLFLAHSLISLYAVIMSTVEPCGRPSESKLSFSSGGQEMTGTVCVCVCLRLSLEVSATV